MSFFSNNIFPTSKLSYGNVKFNIDGTDKVSIDNNGLNVHGASILSNTLSVGQPNEDGV